MTPQYYLYAITNSELPALQSLQGIASQPVLIQKIGAVNLLYSLYPAQEILPVPSIRQNLLKHQEILENLYAQANILPLKFGTVRNLEEATALLAEKAKVFQETLLYFMDKTEVVIKGFWNEMPPVYAEIVQRTPAIQQFKEKMSSGAIPSSQSNLIEVGQMVANALAQHKAYLQKTYLQAFAPITVSALPQDTNHDSMFLNVAFLIPKSQASAFENILTNHPISQDTNVKIKFFGASPPNHFL